ncbi:MAG: response regulator [Lachnospiraceae bacterium]|nr:response regulator [Lachnospiraceae bacterium]
MDYYRVMLVDDEPEAREAIAKRVKWEEMGFCVVAEADNGEDALEKAEQFAPDVVLTDIHMPFMDGLTFCRKLKEMMPQVRIIIFSGYDEFEYAQEAIRLEAEEYILKPINADELVRVFGKIRERLDDDFDRRHNIEKLTRYYQDSLPILKEQFLVGLLEGRLSREQIAAFADDFGFYIDSAFYSVGVLVEDEESGKDHPLTAGLRSVSILNMAKEFFEGEENYTCINYLGTVVVIAGLKSTQAHRQFVDSMDRLCRLCSKQYGLRTVAGIGKSYGNIKGISESFAQAKEASMYRMMLEGDQAIYIGDVEPKSGGVVTLDEKLIDRLVRQIKIGDTESVNEVCDGIVESLRNSSVSMPQLRLNCTELAVELSRLAALYKVEDEWDEPDDLFAQTGRFASFDEMNDWLKDHSYRLMSTIRKDRQDATRLLGEKAIAYVREHFADSGLSVDRVCSHLGVGTTYFSNIFKKQTGMNFVAYLTKVRMEEAVRLLENTDEKSYVIAGKVGYEEPTYFSYVFKKQYGSSPAKYRQNLNKE